MTLVQKEFETAKRRDDKDRADDLKAAQLATAQAINRHSMTLLGMWLLSLVLLGFPDVYFLKTAATASIPVVGATSFKLVLVVLPLLMLAVRVHLDVYIRHERAVGEQLADEGVDPVWTASYMDYPLMRGVRFFVLFLSVPTAFAAMTYKGMVYLDWGAGLLAGTLLVVVVHLVPLLKVASFLSSIEKVAVALVVAIAVAGLARDTEEFRRPFQLDLAELKRADLRGEDLRGASLYRADLEGAVLSSSNLIETYLAEANLTKANLDKANLTEAVLAESNLTEATFFRANLTKANLDNANLTEAYLYEATLIEASLFKANLTEASLFGANLTEANLNEAKFLFQKQLDTACGDGKTKLHKELTIKPCKKKP